MSYLLKKLGKVKKSPIQVLLKKPQGLNKKPKPDPIGADFIKWEKKEYKLLKPRLRKLDIKLDETLNKGSNVDVHHSPKLEKIYGRKNLFLKVFRNSKSIWGFSGAGASSSIFESTVAQNLLAMKGFCPRVYDLVEVEGKTAQVVDFITGFEKPEPVRDPRFQYWMSAWENKINHVGGKMIDFQGTKLKDHNKYKKYLLAETARRNLANGHCSGMYQSVGNNPGIRNSKARLETYKFKDFEGKNVLDIGCSNGMLMRGAYDLGAKRVSGIDYPNMAEMAQELAIMDGYFNLDFFGGNLKKMSGKQMQKLTGIKRFDIHLFFAMENHVGLHPWMKNCDTMYWESHGQPRQWEVRDIKQKVIRKGTYND